MRILENGNYRDITEKDMEAIALYMDDDKRERVHSELAPCAPEDFLRRYVELDPDFITTLNSEFSIEMVGQDPEQMSVRRSKGR